MLRFMYSGISGMKSNQIKLDVTGNNITNVSTTAFKGSSARFSDTLYQSSASATGPTTVLGGTNAKQVGLGTQVSSITKLMGQGNALATNRSLDLCVDGEGYLVTCKGETSCGISVDPATGLDGGEGEGTDTDTDTGTGTTEVTTPADTFYTRDGSLFLDYKGNLVTADGRRVMGYYLKEGEGEKISINYTDSDGKLDTSITVDNGIDFDPDTPVANYVNSDSKTLQAVDSVLRPLAIPDSVLVDGKLDPVSKFEIGKNGVIIAHLGSGKSAALGQVAMASFKNPEGLTDLGKNYCQVSSNSGPSVYLTGYKLEGDNVVDNSKAFGSLIQGCLEGSNVDLTEQFTDMITATRCFQASSKLISTGDEILQTITGLIR